MSSSTSSHCPTCTCDRPDGTTFGRFPGLRTVSRRIRGRRKEVLVQDIEAFSRPMTEDEKRRALRALPRDERRYVDGVCHRYTTQYDYDDPAATRLVDRMYDTEGMSFEWVPAMRVATRDCTILGPCGAQAFLLHVPEGIELRSSRYGVGHCTILRDID